MTANDKLYVEVLDDEIIITLPGTSYAVTYYRATAFPQRLLTKSHSGGEDHDAANDASRVSRSRLEACQRQGARTGVDSVVFRRRAGVPCRWFVLKRCGPLGRAPPK